MRTADAIRLIEVARVPTQFALMNGRLPQELHSRRSLDALFKLETWIREGAIMEDVYGVDPRVDREKHSGKEDALAETSGVVGAPDGAGKRAGAGGNRAGGDGGHKPAPVAKPAVRPIPRRINRFGKGEVGL